jgi:SAM-dependent methyltransferase
VIAIEPLAEMRAVLAREVPDAEPLAATAEQTTLPEASLDAVAAGQAFHWFRADEALREIARVLRPGGAFGLIWNVRDPDDRLQAQLGELLSPYRRGTPSRGGRRWDRVVAAFPTFATVEQRSFAWTAELSAEGFVERVATTSVVAALAEEPRHALLAQVRGLVSGLPEPVAFSYRTDVSVYRRV